MTLYGKDNAVRLANSMLRRDRLPHAFIIFGEKGTGKKTLARYIAQLVLCKSENNAPCGECIACKKIQKNIHPDFIALTPGGKNGNYLSEELRAIVSDAPIAPNESDKKIYFLPGIDRSLPEAQNMLLKVIEEPPAHVMFLMTAEQREKLLPTVLSRVIQLGITEPSPEDCLKALSEHGADPELSREAVNIFGGNIGRCMEYVENGGKLEYLTALQKIVSAIVKRDAFALLAELTALDSKNGRESIIDVLTALKGVLRDISAAKLGTPLCSPARSEAAALSTRIRQSGVEKIYETLSAAEKKINQNCTVPLVMAEIVSVIAVHW